MSLPRRFYLYRRDDVTKISGEGTVAMGVVFTNGRVRMQWCVPGKPRSIVEYDDVAEVEEIHGHDGKTSVIFIDDETGWGMK